MSRTLEAEYIHIVLQEMASFGGGCMLFAYQISLSYSWVQISTAPKNVLSKAVDGTCCTGSFTKVLRDVPAQLMHGTYVAAPFAFSGQGSMHGVRQNLRQWGGAGRVSRMRGRLCESLCSENPLPCSAGICVRAWPLLVATIWTSRRHVLVYVDR